MYKKVIWFLFFTAASFGGFSQNSFDITSENLIDKGLIIEKLYVNTDRSFYMAGEILWFKIYTLDGINNSPLDLSKVAYLELLDKEGKPVIQEKVELKDGKGTGSVYLPMSVNSGNYVLRCYTSWMRNFGPESFFEQILTVTNPFKVPDHINNGDVAPTVKIDFYPEGGDLVHGLRSKVGFKVADATGKGVAATGYVLNENDTIGIISTEKFGLGSFSLIPDKSSTYQIYLTYSDSTYHLQNFPKVKGEGYILAVEDSGQHYHVKVETNLNVTDPVYLVAHKSKKELVIEGKRIENRKAIFSIDKTVLPEGISYLTLFDFRKEPIAERLVFRKPEQLLNIGASKEKELYSTRDNVRIQVETNFLNQAVNDADLTVKVFHLDSLQPNSEDIVSYLLLTSELSGKVESPGYYFTENSTITKDLENLLLTHGWRRFNNTERLKEISHLPEVEGHIIKLKVQQSNVPVSELKSILSVPGKIVNLYASKSTKNGELHFVTQDIYGIKNIIIDPLSTDNASYDFTLISPFIGEDNSIHLPAFQLEEDLKEAIRKRSIAMQAQNVYLGDKKNNVVREIYTDSIHFYGSQAKKYLLDNYTRFPTMEEVMREYVTEVLVRKKDEQYNFKVMNRPLQTFFQENPLVLLDGVPLSNINTIINYDPLKIRSLDVVSGVYMLGSDIWADGIVNYSTYKGDMEGLVLEPDQVQIDYEGLQLMRNFYSPDYTENKGNSRIPDFRTLLYWKPNLETDKEGNAVVNFFTSDIEGKFLVVVEGLTNDGKLGVTSTEFTVEQD